MERDLSAFPEPGIVNVNLIGLAVEASDGQVGTVDEETRDIGNGRFVVDTGGWITGRKVVLPAGVVTRVDLELEKVCIGLTKDDVENAPEWDHTNPLELEDYFGARLGPGAGV
jgi:hypothetical protein